MMLELRRAVAADAAAVRALTRAAYAKWVPLIGREPRPMGADQEAAIRDHRVDLAIVDGHVAGSIETIRWPGYLWIENVAVDPAFQGRGIGRALLAHAEKLAAELGVRTLRLLTNQKFAANIDLYLRLGYRVDREEVLPIGVAVHMSKPIA
ncbi:MAG TPA: GNAT family N-acetyltransferase [Reyranella sp.]|nr:GNAT family N-acetyltransferase [Reyranella sp.]